MGWIGRTYGWFRDRLERVLVDAGLVPVKDGLPN